jgi:RNA polymerase sigma-70 factor (ECF subfamily)
LGDDKQIAELRAQMLRFANTQLGDASQAEDAVQEALAGALRNSERFRGEAALKTWVFAILRRKIIDVIRRRSREPALGTAATNDGENEDFSALFDQSEHWHADSKPQAWRDPDGACEDDGFWLVFQMCLDEMPEKQARIFMMREFLELETKEIIAADDITESNLNVVLYRARMRLRECLNSRWFAGDA